MDAVRGGCGRCGPAALTGTCARHLHVDTICIDLPPTTTPPPCAPPLLSTVSLLVFMFIGALYVAVAFRCYMLESHLVTCSS